MFLASWSKWRNFLVSINPALQFFVVPRNGMFFLQIYELVLRYRYTLPSSKEFYACVYQYISCAGLAAF